MNALLAITLTVMHTVVPLAGIGNLKAVVTIPEGAGKKPALLLAGWLSCDSVASTDENDGFVRFLDGVAKHSNFVFMRVDKPGVGGSEGNCAATDFQTELAGYRAAWKQLASMPQVDASKMFVIGLSNGGGFAPLVPTEPRAAGFISISGWGRTWFEHMMSFERRRLTLSGAAPAEISKRMKATARFYDEYLNKRRSPADILKAEPDLAIAWEGSTSTQYGRPPAFYQQLQDLNLADAWCSIDVPSLVIHGGQDWIMDSDDVAPIAQCVAAHGKFEELPKMDHFFFDHDSMAASFQSRGPKQFDSRSVDIVVEWLQHNSR